MDDAYRTLRRRTTLAGTVFLLVVAAGLVASIVELGLHLSLVIGIVTTIGAALAFASVRRTEPITVAGRRLDPFQRAGVGYVLLAASVGAGFAPHLSADWNGFTVAIWILVFASFGYQELTGPHEEPDPSMRQVAAILTLLLVFIIGLPVAVIFLG